jgi:VanZ family protein
MAAPRSLTVGLAWLPALCWAATIWMLGGDDWSASETSRYLGPLIDWLLPDIDRETRARLMAGVRKLAHPGVYGVLAALSFGAASWALRSGQTAGRVALSLAPVALLAIGDEWRQSTSAARTGAALDVALDLAGGLAVVALALAAERMLGRRLFAGRAHESRQRAV